MRRMPRQVATRSHPIKRAELATRPNPKWLLRQLSAAHKYQISHYCGLRLLMLVRVRQIQIFLMELRACPGRS
jgi:hypothetical protein